MARAAAQQKAAKQNAELRAEGLPTPWDQACGRRAEARVHLQRRTA